MKCYLSIIALFLATHFAWAQKELRLSIDKNGAISLGERNASNEAFADQPTSTTVTFAHEGKNQRFTVTVDKAIAEKDITITIDPEKNLSCDSKLIVLPGKTLNHNISSKALFAPEGTTTKTTPLGNVVVLSVTVRHGNSTSQAHWDINTNLPTLTTCNDKSSSTDAKDIVTGIAYYDAATLASTTEKNIALQILSAYASKQLNDSTAKIYYNDNPFIRAYLEHVSTMTEIGGAQGARSAQEAVKAALHSVGGLDVTTIADGFAKFLVKRTKEELNIAFFSKLKSELADEKYSDLRILFPHTFRALNAIGDDIYNYQPYIQTLRECFEKDLAGLLTTFPGVIDNHPAFFDDQPELEAILRTGLYVAKSFQDKKHPGNILADLPMEYFDRVNTNIKPGVKTLQIISQSLRNYIPEDASSDDERYWITDKQFKSLFRDKRILLLYLGLVREEAHQNDIVFTTGTKSLALATLLDSTYRQIDIYIPVYKKYIQGFYSNVQTVEQKLKDLRAITRDSLLVENYYSFFNASLDLLRYVTQAENLPRFREYFPEARLQESMAPYLATAQVSADLAIDINRRNYASAIVNAHTLLATVFERDNKTSITKIESLIIAAPAESSSKKKLMAEKESLVNGTTLLATFYKYGTFMATLVQAQSSDEVQAAIEAFALPAGSSRIKRESRFNVSLNAYTGLFVGYEKLSNLDKNVKPNSFGVTAPIGVAISSGRRSFLRIGDKHWSYSAFVSLVDLGAIAAYRFTSTTDKDGAKVDQVPTIQLKDIFSPGLFFSIGIPKSPLSINVGSQMGPSLRKVSSDSNATINNAYAKDIYWRHSVSLVVDIPIINFHTRKDPLPKK